MTGVQFCKNCLSARYLVKGSDWDGDYEHSYWGFVEVLPHEEGALEAVCERCGCEEFVVVWLQDDTTRLEDVVLKKYSPLREPFNRPNDLKYFEDVAVAAILIVLAGKGWAELRRYDCVSSMWLHVADESAIKETLKELLAKVPGPVLAEAKRLLLEALI